MCLGKKKTTTTTKWTTICWALCFIHYRQSSIMSGMLAVLSSAVTVERLWNDSLCSQLDPELQIRALWSASPSAFIQFPDAAGVKNKKVAQSCLINRSPSGTVYSLSSFMGMPENLSRRPREYPLHSPTKYRAPSCRKLSLQSSQELRYLQGAGSQESLWKQTSLLGCTAGVLPSSALKDT